jgi:hypothetical protein
MAIGDGSSIGAAALAEGISSAWDVVSGFTGTFGGNMSFVLLLSIVSATLWGVKYLIHRYTSIHSTGLSQVDFLKGRIYAAGNRAASMGSGNTGWSPEKSAAIDKVFIGDKKTLTYKDYRTAGYSDDDIPLGAFDHKERDRVNSMK